MNRVVNALNNKVLVAIVVAVILFGFIRTFLGRR